MKKLNLLSMLIALSFGVMSGVQAQTTATAPMNVSATVSASCNLSATPLNFGSINLTNASSGFASANANIVFNCTKGTSYSIKMDGGTHSDGTNRYMGNTGTDKLMYYIYDNASLSIPLDSSFTNGTATGNSTTLMISGSLATNQVAAAGSYSDVVTVSITY
jgi:spore coat protein U-like protein